MSVAVVSGAASGIGRALAIEAARRGMRVALCDVDAAGLAESRSAIGGDSLARQADVRDAAAMLGFALEAAAMGPITRVFANAGVLRPGPIASQDESEWGLMIDVNLRGTVHMIQAFLPLLKAQAGESRLVITGSQASLVAYPKLGLYSASKHALWGLAEALREELRETAPQVGVSLLCPGAVATPMTSETAGGASHMPPADAARLAHDGADAGRFWIFTHPEFRLAVETRLRRLLAEAWDAAP